MPVDKPNAVRGAADDTAKPEGPQATAHIKANSTARIGQGQCLREWQLLCKKQAQRSQKSAATLSKTSPERLIFEKTGVEIQRTKCCGHLDMKLTGYKSYSRLQ
jgi:hypothetical protein